MKRFLSISFLILYLFSFTEFHQMLRLPILVEHFKEHKSKVSSMTFIEFLVLHYKTDVAHDEHDMELPFKDCCYSAAAQTVLPVSPFSMDLALLLADNEHESFYYSHKPHSLAGEIFQPPRV